MESITLKATKRDVIGKKVKVYRRQGKLPAVVYGRDTGSIPVWLDARDANKALRSVGSSSFVIVDVEGTPYTTLVRERQRDYLRDTLLHVDFQVIPMGETLRTEVPLVLEGEAPALTLGLELVTGLNSVEVESLPKNLPSSITVDLSILKEMGDRIEAKDLPLPEGVTLLTDGEEMVAQVVAPAGAAEEEAAEEEALEGEPEVIEKGKGEEEDF
ncbi:MAG: 50S ribosomal protein L25 [Anaerolineae bacterium]|nr:MAG: 50S ribosomal protein L25 [Anaerolineae bacterium]